MAINIPSLPPNAEIALMVALNFVSVVGVIALNKAAYQAGFTYATTLMCLHFIGTFLFVSALNRAGVFESKRISTKQYVLLGSLQMGSVVFVNLSLFYNTVGTYQVFKYKNTPATAITEYAWQSKLYQPKVYATLVVLCLCVTFATVSTVEFSIVGTFFGILGALFTALYQVRNKMIQSQFDVNSFQLLQYEQPYTAFFSFLMLFLTDNVPSLVQADWFRTNTILLVFLSCVCAFGVNVTTYLIIGKTSALTFSMVGYLKTIGVFMWGFVVLREPFRWKFVVGCVGSFISMVYYSSLMQQKPKAPEHDSKEIVGDALAEAKDDDDL